MTAKEKNKKVQLVHKKLDKITDMAETVFESLNELKDEIEQVLSQDDVDE